MRCVTVAHRSPSPNYRSLKNWSATVAQFCFLQLWRWYYWSMRQVPWALFCVPGLLGHSNKCPCTLAIIATPQALASSQNLCIAMSASTCSTRAANQTANKGCKQEEQTEKGHELNIQWKVPSVRPRHTPQSQTNWQRNSAISSFSIYSCSYWDNTLFWFISPELQ